MKIREFNISRPTPQEIKKKKPNNPQVFKQKEYDTGQKHGSIQISVNEEF